MAYYYEQRIIKFQDTLVMRAQPRAIFNRPGVAGADLQTPPILINLLILPFPPNHQNIITPKP